MIASGFDSCGTEEKRSLMTSAVRFQIPTSGLRNKVAIRAMRPLKLDLTAARLSVLFDQSKLSRNGGAVIVVTSLNHHPVLNTHHRAIADFGPPSSWREISEA